MSGIFTVNFPPNGELLLELSTGIENDYSYQFYIVSGQMIYAILDNK
jgi:hypothetical protein